MNDDLKRAADMLTQCALLNADQHAKARERAEDLMWQAIDIFAMFPKMRVDPRTWDRLLIYKPKD